MERKKLPPGYNDMLNFRLIDALMGRRSRRFFMGADIPCMWWKHQLAPYDLSRSNLRTTSI
jgi:hypothetical protein